MKRKYSIYIYIIVCVFIAVYGAASLRGGFMEGKITISIASTEDTDYRLYQSISGKNVRAESDYDDISIEVKDCGDGSVVKIDGIRNMNGNMIKGGKITITYDTTRDKVTGKQPDASSYDSWINEYPCVSDLSGSSSVGLSGDRGYLAITNYTSVYYLNVMKIFKAAACLIFILMMIFTGLKKIKTKKSSQELLAYLERNKDTWWYKSKKNEAFYKGESYLEKRRTVGVLFQGLIVFIGIYFIGMIDKRGSIILLWMCVILVILWIACTIVYVVHQKKLMEILIEKCDPYSCLMALSCVYRRKRGIAFKTQYIYDINCAVSLFWCGEFEEALKYGDMVWEETKNRTRNSIYFVHYHGFRRKCLQELNMDEEALREEKDIQEFLESKPKYKKNAMAVSILEQTDVNSLMREGRLEEAEESALTLLDKSKEKYQRIGTLYTLYKIERMLSKDDESEKYREMIINDGGDLYPVYKLRGEASK